MKPDFVYLVAIIDGYSRGVLWWRLSNTLDARLCVEAHEEALDHFGMVTQLEGTRGEDRRLEPSRCYPRRGTIVSLPCFK